MNIKQFIVNGDTVYVFTESPETDIIKLQEVYENETEEAPFPLGYEKPMLAEYEFLGNKHKCISLWFDNEDIPDVFFNPVPPRRLIINTVSTTV